jgi:hypothetical protein
MEQEVEVMRVIRVPPLGKLQVQVGNRRFTSLSEVEDEPTKHRLMAAVGELIVFTDGYEALVTAGVAPPLSTDQAGMTSIPASMEDRQNAFLAELERQRDAARAEAASAASTAAVEPIVESPEASSLSIVGQIDRLLQKHLATQPELSGRSIHLEGDPAGGLRIKIDGRYFQKPGDVEDEAIQQAILSALKEWDAA